MKLDQICIISLHTCTNTFVQMNFCGFSNLYFRMQTRYFFVNDLVVVFPQNMHIYAWNNETQVSQHSMLTAHTLFVCLTQSMFILWYSSFHSLRVTTNSHHQFDSTVIKQMFMSCKNLNTLILNLTSDKLCLLFIVSIKSVRISVVCD